MSFMDQAVGSSFPFTPNKYPYSVQQSLPLGTPASIHGQNLLNKTTADMNLPPEDWADEVKDLNAQVGLIADPSECG